VTWGDPRLYDLVLNTDRISVESCVEQIATLVRRPEFAETPQSKALLANMTLEARIQVAFKDHAATDDISITVSANEGKVTLQGIVLNNEERSQAELVAAGVAGVVSVDNQLRLMASSRRFASAKY
jgi:hypothetical protein